MTIAFTLNTEKYEQQSVERLQNFTQDLFDTYTDNSNVPFKDEPLKIKIGKFNFTVIANNEPSEDAIKKTNRKVNELMYEVYKRDKSLF
ncbi:hypothetical protein ABEV77_22255 [Bacillus subtilis]|nr:hypothetical protein [Bacillus subtilis]